MMIFTAINFEEANADCVRLNLIKFKTLGCEFSYEKIEERKILFKPKEKVIGSPCGMLNMFEYWQDEDLDKFIDIIKGTDIFLTHEFWLNECLPMALGLMRNPVAINVLEMAKFFAEDFEVEKYEKKYENKCEMIMSIFADVWQNVKIPDFICAPFMWSGV